MASELYVETLKGLTSGANANKVIIPSGQTLDASAGGFTTPAGHVIQVVSSTHTGGGTLIASSSYTDTGLEASITPSSSDSKILILINPTVLVSMNSDDYTISYSNIVKNGTTTLHQKYSYNYAARAPNGYIEFSIDHNMCYLDSPNTTQETTYKMQAKRNAGRGMLFNFTSGGVANPSTITLMEIAG